MDTRLYVVYKIDGTAEHLVRGVSRAGARNHVSESVFGVRLASQDDIVRLLTAGVHVEDTSHEQAALQLE